MQIEDLNQARLPIQYSIDPEFSSERFVKMRLRICHEGVNLNRTSFTVDTFQDAAPSLPYTPIVAEVEFDENGEPQFTGHAMHVEPTEDGNRLIYDECPIGVIPERCNYQLEESNGKLFVCTDAYIWRKYTNYALDIVEREEDVPLSMEIEISDFTYQKKLDVYEIKKFTYSGITFCPDPDQVAMRGAGATKIGAYMQKGPQMEFFTLLKESLKEELAQMEQGSEDVEDTVNVQPTEENEVVTDEITEDVETPEEIEPEETTEEEPEAPAENNEVEPQDEEEAPNIEYQLHRNLVDACYKALEQAGTIQFEGVDLPKYSFEDIDVEKGRLYAWAWEDCEVYGVDFKLNGDVVELVGEFKRQVREYRDFIEGTATDDSAVGAYMHNMLSEGAKLRTEYEAVQTELKELREYKQACEEAQKQEEIAVVLEQFSNLEGNSDFEELKAHSSEYSVADLEKECYAILGKSVSNKFTKQTRSTSAGRVVLPPLAEQDNTPRKGSLAILEQYTKSKKG